MKNEPTMNTVTETALGYFMEHKGMYSQADVEKLLATARAEGAQEERKYQENTESGLWRTDKHPFDLFMDVYKEAKERWKNPDDFNEYMPELLKQAIKNNFWQALTTKEHHAS